MLSMRRIELASPGESEKPATAQRGSRAAGSGGSGVGLRGPRVTAPAVPMLATILLVRGVCSGHSPARVRSNPSVSLTDTPKLSCDIPCTLAVVSVEAGWDGVV